MTIHLSRDIEEQLRQLAKARGLNVEALAQEAVRQYLVSCSITDVTAEDIVQAQAILTPELPGWKDRPMDLDPDASQ